MGSGEGWGTPGSLGRAFDFPRFLGWGGETSYFSQILKRIDKPGRQGFRTRRWQILSRPHLDAYPTIPIIPPWAECPWPPPPPLPNSHVEIRPPSNVTASGGGLWGVIRSRGWGPPRNCTFPGRDLRELVPLLKRETCCVRSRWLSAKGERPSPRAPRAGTPTSGFQPPEP